MENVFNFIKNNDYLFTILISIGFFSFLINIFKRANLAIIDKLLDEKSNKIFDSILLLFYSIVISFVFLMIGYIIYIKDYNSLYLIIIILLLFVFNYVFKSYKLAYIRQILMVYRQFINYNFYIIKNRLRLYFKRKIINSFVSILLLVIKVIFMLVIRFETILVFLIFIFSIVIYYGSNENLSLNEMLNISMVINTFLIYILLRKISYNNLIEVTYIKNYNGLLKIEDNISYYLLHSFKNFIIYGNKNNIFLCNIIYVEDKLNNTTRIFYIDIKKSLYSNIGKKYNS